MAAKRVLLDSRHHALGAPSKHLQSAHSVQSHILGCDFTSAPTSRKPITLAWTRRVEQTLHLEHIQPCFDFSQFLHELTQTDWIGGFDMPFGLPTDLVHQLRWPPQWLPYMRHFTQLTRADIRLQFKAFCDARPAGQKFAHRATDIPAASSPSMKWVNPPVAFMLHAGVPLLLDAGASLVPVHWQQTAPDAAQRVALEAYPAFAARPLIGNTSYKSDDVRKQNLARQHARQTLVQSVLNAPHPQLGLRLVATPALVQRLIDDASGDSLDAVLCAMQAAWASQQDNYGIPAQASPLEGWIVSVPWAGA